MKHNLRFLTAILFLLLFSAPLQAERLNLSVYTDVGGDFTLTDQHGKKFKLSEQTKKITLLFFGYLHCPDICPMTLSEMMSVKELLGANVDQVQFAMITLDPERDDEKSLKQYLMNFDPEFLGLYGGRAQIEKIAKEYKVLHKRRELRSALGYSVDHSGGVYLLDKQARLRYIFPTKSPASRYLQAIEMLVEGRASAKPRTKTWLDKLLKR